MPSDWIVIPARPPSDWTVIPTRSPYVWCFNDSFDDDILDIATSQGTEDQHTYSATILNGVMLERDGYLKTEVNDPGTTGYSRLVHTPPLPMFPHRMFLEASFIVKTWNQYSDIALGLSFERTVGNTAYRGDLAIWIDYWQVKLYFRPSRTDPATTINIGEINLKAEEHIILTLNYEQGIVTVTANHEGTVEVVYTRDVGRTYENSPLYGMFGGRGSGEVTEIWMDNYQEIGGKLWQVVRQESGLWQVVRP